MALVMRARRKINYCIISVTWETLLNFSSRRIIFTTIDDFFSQCVIYSTVNAAE